MSVTDVRVGTGEGTGPPVPPVADAAATPPRRPRSVRVRTARARPWTDAPALALLVLLAVLPMLPVYGPRPFWPAAAGGVVMGAGVGVLAARLRWPVSVTAAGALTVHLLAGGALAAPSTTLAGVVPSVETLRLLLAGVVTVWKDVLTLEPPLGEAGGFTLAPYLLAFVGSLVAVSVALRTSAARRDGPLVPGGRRRVGPAPWAVLVPVVVLVVALLLGTKETVAPLVAGVVAAVVALVWSARRRGALAARRAPALVLMAAVMAYGGVIGGAQLADDHPRYVLRDEVVPPFDPRDHPSPLSAFRRFVKDWESTPLLTVRGLPEGVPVRLATMDAYDGVVWDVAGSSVAEGSGRFRRVGETTGVTARGERHEVELVAHELPMVWLPTVGWTERFTFADDDGRVASRLRYNDATGTAVLTGGVPEGLRWTAEVVVPPEPDDEALAGASVADVVLPEPTGVPDAVPMFAGDVAGTATSPALIARTLEEALAERGWFSHGLVDQGQPPSLSGHGADRMTTLLTGDLMVGDGEQYASAMALMARELGLPARVVLGFVVDDDTEVAPGEGGETDEVTITGSDVQAWVEIAFAGHGWVSFHPTPDDSRIPREDTPTDASEPEPQVVQPPPPPPEPVQPPPEDTDQARTEDTEEYERSDDTWRRVLVAVGVASVPVLLVLGPLVLVALAKRRRRRRRRNAPDPVERVVGGWDELLDQARDLRRPAPRAATRRETAVRLATAFAPRARTGAPGRRDGAVSSAVAGLAAGADAFVFGPGTPAPEDVSRYWAEVDGAVAAMRRSVPRRDRWRARWSAASLRDRRRARRRAGRGSRRGVRRS